MAWIHKKAATPKRDKFALAKRKAEKDFAAVEKTNKWYSVAANTQSRIAEIAKGALPYLKTRSLVSSNPHFPALSYQSP